MEKEWDKVTVKQFWDSNEAPYAGEITSAEVVRLARRYLRHGDRVLDVGAGSGALVRRIPGAIGVDISPKCREVMLGDIESLPFPDSTFDVVFVVDVIEHLSYSARHKGVIEVQRVLKPDGVLVATVPNREDMSLSTVRCPYCQAKFHRWGHTQSFSPSSLRYFLLLRGFKHVQIRALPLSLMAEHWLIRHFYPLFLKFRFCQASSLFVVAQR